MFAKGLFTNLVLIIVSVGIFFTYLQPNFNSIRTDQDVIAQYQQERSKVQMVNARLNELASAADQLSIDERNRMYTYLPNEVDEVAVQRDILLIAESMGIDLTTLSYAGRVGVTPVVDESGEVQSTRSSLIPHQFNVAFSVTYDQFKEFLGLLEQSNYPLHVSGLTVSGSAAESADSDDSSTADSTLGITMTITTYAIEMQENAY